MSHSDDAASPPAPQGEYHSQYTTLTDRVFITSLLKRTREAHALLRVNLPNQSVSYNSTLLEIRANEDCIELDELHPEEGHTQVSPGGTLHVMTRLHGVEIRFQLTVESIRRAEGIAIYRCPLPQRIQHLQRRAHYRAQSARGQHLVIRLAITPRQHMEAELIDLSIGGLAVRSKNGESHGMAKGRRLEHCTVSLPGQRQPLVCTLEVRTLCDEKHGGYLRLGLAFVALDARQRQQVERAVAALDRDNRKRASRTPDA